MESDPSIVAHLTRLTLEAVYQASIYIVPKVGIGRAGFDSKSGTQE